MNNATLTIPAPVCRMMRRATEIRVLLNSKADKLKKTLQDVISRNDAEETEVFYALNDDSTKLSGLAFLATEAEDIANDKASKGDFPAVRRALRISIRCNRLAMAV